MSDDGIYRRNTTLNHLLRHRFCGGFNEPAAIAIVQRIEDNSLHQSPYLVYEISPYSFAARGTHKEISKHFKATIRGQGASSCENCLMLLPF